MSDHRKRVETWYKSLPPKLGKKVTKKRELKVELYPIYLWAKYWEPSNKFFSPKLPMHSVKRLKYWATRYRVKVNGRWLKEEAKFQSFTKAELRYRFFR